jgi:hypothetical protein
MKENELLSFSWVVFDADKSSEDTTGVSPQVVVQFLFLASGSLSFLRECLILFWICLLRERKSQCPKRSALCSNTKGNIEDEMDEMDEMKNPNSLFVLNQLYRPNIFLKYKRTCSYYRKSSIWFNELKNNRFGNCSSSENLQLNEISALMFKKAWEVCLTVFEQRLGNSEWTLCNL